MIMTMSVLYSGCVCEWGCMRVCCVLWMFMCVFVCCEDYDDLEFSIVSLDGRQWLFEAATHEVCFLSSHSASDILHIGDRNMVTVEPSAFDMISAYPVTCRLCWTVSRQVKAHVLQTYTDGPCKSAVCGCNQQLTVNHTVDIWPWTKFEGSLQSLC